MKISLQRRFSNYLAPTFHGMTFSQWMNILQDKNLTIDFPYQYRLFPTTFKSIANSVLTRIEKQTHQPKYEQVVIKPPIFIIGHWRSGTTLLQNILANDHRFAYPNFYQVTNPNTFLVTEETLITKLFSFFVPKNRLFDDVPFGLKSPHEDEFIAWHSSGLTPCMSWNFPNSADQFDKYLSLKSCDITEVNRWQNALIIFLKKLTYKYNKRIMLKSPQHTARIKLILEMFPQARFIHIYRNPYQVYQSTKRLHEFVYSISTFQKFDSDKIHKRILNQYKEMYDIFFEEKNSIPDQQLIEIKFESFEDKPLDTLKMVYKTLNFPEFEEIEKRYETYLKSIDNHKKNKYKELNQSLKDEIYYNWQRNFNTWGYNR